MTMAMVERPMDGRWIIAAPDVSGANSDDHLVSLFLGTRTRSERTRATYNFEIRRFRRLVRRPLAVITLDDLRGYLQALREGGLSDGTVARALTVVRCLLGFARMTGYLRFNVAEAVSVPRPRGRREARFLTPGECERMLDAARSRGTRSLAIVGLLLGLGLRRDELRRASWGDLFDDGAGRTGLRVRGKGNKDRTVKVRPDLMAVLRRHRAERGLGADLDPADASPLALNRDGARASACAIHRLVTSVARAAGLRKRPSPHWLRHSHASAALQNGATVEQLREALGHSSIAVTSVYLHAATGLADTAADHLPFEIGGGDA
jgi:integrase/recombinase XerD